jgi:hypothetical protein
MSKSRHLRRELPSTSSRLALHRAWAALNHDAWVKVQQEQLAALNQAAAAARVRADGAAKPALEPVRRQPEQLHHNGEPVKSP